jgi:hypothetical protein
MVLAFPMVLALPLLLALPLMLAFALAVDFDSRPAILPNRSRIVFSSSVMTSSSSLHSLLIFLNLDEHFLDTHFYTKTRQEMSLKDMLVAD